MKYTAADPSIWTDRDQAFGVAALHQLHCVVRMSSQPPTEFADANSKGTLKHSFTEFERTGNMTSSSKHTHHCIETLRQAVLCATVLTLEKLDVEDITSPFKPQRGNSGWGNVHTCRDWTRLAEMFRQRGIIKSNTGWMKVPPFDGVSATI